MRKITVIIPNYNGRKFLDSCMSALSRQTCRDFCVLVVDNGSTDGSVPYLRELEQTGLQTARPTAPGDAAKSSTWNAAESAARDIATGAAAKESIPVQALYLPENTGFSGAVNAGLAAVSTEYVILLNNDTEADPRYVEELLKSAQQDSVQPDSSGTDSAAADSAQPDSGQETSARANGAGTVAAVSPLMLSLKDPTVIDSAGDGYAVCGWAFQRGVGRKANLPKFGQRTGVFSACAGGALYLKSALDAIAVTENGRTWWFDPEHFAYLEDVDVSYRLRLEGYRIVYEPRAKVLHAGSATSGSRYNDFKVRLAARNNVYLNVKNMPLLQLLVNLPFLLAGVLVKQLFFVSRGFGKSYFAGFCEGIRKIPRVWPHRVRVTWKRLPWFFAAEGRMIADTFSYAGDLLGRHLLHR